jgi:hypothetical protein
LFATNMWQAGANPAKVHLTGAVPKSDQFLMTLTA